MAIPSLGRKLNVIWNERVVRKSEEKALDIWNEVGGKHWPVASWAMIKVEMKESALQRKRVRAFRVIRFRYRSGAEWGRFQMKSARIEAF
jgi:hypothetical protein